MSTVLAAVNFSDVTPAVVRAACRLVVQLRARLALLHVVEDLTAYEKYGVGSELMLPAVQANERFASRRLAVLARRCAKRVRSVRAHLRVGKPVTVILAEARAIKPAFLVVGSHGEGAVYDLVIGSVAHGILRHAPCPVVLVPSHRRR